MKNTIQENYEIELIRKQTDLQKRSGHLRLFYIVDGSAVFSVNGVPCSVRHGDILQASRGDICELKNPASLLCVCLSVNPLVFHTLENPDPQFSINSAADRNALYDDLREKIADFLIAEADGHSEIRAAGCFCLLLDEMLKNFRADTGAVSHSQDPRIAKMLRYIHTRYHEEASLKEAAEEVFLSPSAASRLFLKGTGGHFLTYLRDYRLTRAEEMLLTSDFSVSKTAAENGFSTASAFNRIFLEKHGITPSEFRKKNRELPREKKDEVQLGEIQKLLQEEKKKKEFGNTESLSVRCSAAKAEPVRRWENRILNVGPVHVLSDSAIQNQVLYLVDHLRVEYIRLWNPFSKRMRLYYNGTFNYMLLDQILDFCVDHRIKVFLDLAQRKEVAMASEQSVIYETDDSTVFESAFEWMNALSSVLGHIRKRYGEHIAGSWIYEISFFLNDKPYYISDSYRSSLAYEQSYAVIRRCLPAARIAAPGLPGMSDSDTCELLISELLKTKYSPDIFTSIHFPYGLDFSSSDESIYQERYRKIIDYDFLDSHLDIVNSVLAAKGFQGEHWITDWGNSIANRNYLQDSCYRAVYLADSALRNYKKVGAMGIFYASDSLNAFFDSNKILSGSAGILTQNGIRKPAYYAFKFMSSLGRYLIERGDRYIITCENDRDIRILCWNRIPPDKDYFLSEENSRNPQELEGLFRKADSQSAEFALELSRDSGTWRVRHTILNEENGSILNRWIALQCEEELTRDDMEYLSRTTAPLVTSSREELIEGVLRFSFVMKPHELRLITVSGQ